MYIILNYSQVWLINLTIYLDFLAIFSQIAASKPSNQGRTRGECFESHCSKNRFELIARPRSCHPICKIFSEMFQVSSSYEE